MKVAVLLTGHLRTYREQFSALDNVVLRQHDTDVFCCTWDQTQTRIGEPSATISDSFSDIYGDRLKGKHVVSVGDYQKSKVPLQLLGKVELSDPRAREHFALGWHERLRDQWWLVKKCWELMPNPTVYDVVLRLRFDTRLHSCPIKQVDGLVVPRDVGGWWLSDHLAYGSPEAVRVYCHLVDHVQTVYTEHDIDISHAIKLLDFYLQHSGVPTETDPSIIYEIAK